MDASNPIREPAKASCNQGAVHIWAPVPLDVSDSTETTGTVFLAFLILLALSLTQQRPVFGLVTFSTPLLLTTPGGSIE